MSPTVWMSPAVTAPGPCLRTTMRLAVAFHADGDFLDVENDVGDIFAHTRDRREFVQHAIDLDRGHGSAAQRGQQNAAQRIAERQAKPRSSGSATTDTLVRLARELDLASA
jgi:hypothetical protein